MRSAVVAFLVAASLAAAQSSTNSLQPGREHIAGVDVFLGMVQSPAGYPIRVFITRPKGTSGKLPVIFMVGWLSCDSVEAPNGPKDDGFEQLFFELAARSGFATYRVEKPGVGDSGGPKCGDADFQAELTAYRAGFAAMKQLEFVDPARIYMLGFSNGAGFAPLVAGDTPVRAYMVFSGWYKTWLEHMLEIERRRMKLSGVAEPVINRQMKGYAVFYDLYLNEKQLPGQIIREHPELKEIWYDKPEGQYGRPAAYYHQLQALNLAEAWSAVSAPVLAVHGEFDWIMSAEDCNLLADAINSRKGSAQCVFWPHADHDLLTHATLQKAYGRDPDQSYDSKLSQFTLDWLKKH